MNHSAGVVLTQDRTFYQTTNVWPMKDNADPLSGWPSEDVAAASSGAATADVYGKLFFYIRRLLHSFLDRLSGLDVSFELFQVDVTTLPDLLEENAFSRIEVSRRHFIRSFKCKQTFTFKAVLIYNAPQKKTLMTLIVLHRFQIFRMLAGWEYTARFV